MRDSKGIAVIGSMTADVTAKAHILPRLGETVQGNEFTLVSGGKGSNQAVMAARMGVPTWMVGCVGEDAFRHVILNSLHENGVNTSFVDILPKEKTGIAHIRVDESANNNIVIVQRANAKTDEKKVDAFFATDPQVNVLLLQLEIPVTTVVYAAKRARERGITVIFDPAPAEKLPEEIYKSVDIVTPNESEASLLTGIEVTDVESATIAAKVFLDKGVKTSIITLGEKGVLVVNRGGVQHIPAYMVKAIDTTAAGDAFTGTLGACLSDGVSLEKSIQYSMAAGAYAVTKLGAQTSLPSKKEVLQLVEGGNF